MGLFNFLKTTQRYDMDSLEGIQSIPVPAKNYNTGNTLNDCIYYLLQRKATEHKKNGRIDLAIACLKKSNELSDYESRPLLTEKDYLRLVKYLEQAGRKNEAIVESEKIYKRHPEFKDKRISNLKRIQDTIDKCKKRKEDLVYIDTSRTCPICSKYHRQVFSISGKHKKYPKLPREIINNGGFCPNCIISISTFFEGISTPPKR